MYIPALFGLVYDSSWSPLSSRLLDPGVNLDQLASRGRRSNPAVDRCAGAIGHGMGPQDQGRITWASCRQAIGFEVWGTSQRMYIYIHHIYKRECIYNMYILWICIYIYICLLTPVWCLLKHTTWIGVISGKQWGFFDFQVSLPFQGTHPTVRKMN